MRDEFACGGGDSHIISLDSIVAESVSSNAIRGFARFVVGKDNVLEMVMEFEAEIM